MSDRFSYGANRRAPVADPIGNRRMLRLPNVLLRVGLGRSHVLAMVKSGDFPAPVKLGARAVAWVESEVNAWIEARINSRPCPQADGASG